ncbi:hypothetical protein NHX12_030752, partial [Muraenolepis orangiensis]
MIRGNRGSRGRSGGAATRAGSGSPGPGEDTGGMGYRRKSVAGPLDVQDLTVAAGHKGRGQGRGQGHRGNRGARPNERQSRSGTPNSYPMSYRFLEELSEKPPSEMAIILSNGSAFQALLDEREIRPDLVQLVCSALSRAFQTRLDRSTIQHLAGVVKDSGFLRTVLPQYIGGMMSESDPARREQYPQHFDNMIAVLSKVLSIFPASSVQAVSVLVVLLQASLLRLKTSGADIGHQTEEKLENLQTLINQLQEKSREGSLLSDRDTFPLLADQLDNQGEEGLESFRTIPIYPTREEFHDDERPYLRPNVTTQRHANAEIYLDTHFRLLREDFVRPLREGIQKLIWSHLNTDAQQLKKERFDDITVYFDVTLELPMCTRSGLAYVIKFDTKPLKFVRWENSKRLLYGSLVCMSCDNFESFLFATVSERELKDVKKGLIQVMFSDESRQKLATMQTNRPFLMVETSAYFEAYCHVLEGLQEVQANELPFSRYIVECSADVQPPQYLRANDTYNLMNVADPQFRPQIKPFHCLRPADWPPMTHLNLDQSQMKAFQMALTHELAIIQGPPGTGKTHVGLKIAQAMLTNSELWCGDQGNTQMLVVCYTNHALDQFLEGIHTFLQSGIVRVGGRSTSEILKPFLLKNRMEEFRKYGKGISKHLRYAFKEPEADEEGAEDEETEDYAEAEADDFIHIAAEAALVHAERYIDDGNERPTSRASAVQDLQEAEKLMLAMTLTEAPIQTGQNQYEWEMQNNQKKRIKKKMRMELKKTSDMTREQEEAIVDIWRLSMPNRWRLYRLWVSRYRASLQDQLQQSEEEYQNVVERLEDVRRSENVSLLREAKVIGMTTTGAAKFRKILQEVRPRVVIVEEAAEVLEAHTITSLNPECQHLILIGDHQQLRPSATVYDLAKRYNLEVSMFERLVKNNFPFVRLNYQLENHPSVMDYDNVKGIETNLFFVEHSHLEEHIKDGKSHENKHEAKFVVALCRYLLMQDYNPEQITILTTYSGQLYCLRNLMPSSEFEGVRVHVVDKYQGEENDIVLLSLVRSNAQGKMGFLSIANRVCVALSRAKKGLYCIGNSELLSKVKLWSDIFGTLKENEQMGKALHLCCQNHPEKQIQVACAEDFKQAPEGGCLTPCEYRLDCGHVCTRVCHPYDPEHKKYKCQKPCERILCDLRHKCPLVCHRPCPKCPVLIEKTIPMCQHKQMVPCHMEPAEFKCMEPCEKSLQCGHQCIDFCGSPCTINCRVKVPLILKCEHTQIDFCYYNTKDYEPNCKTKCELQLKCGHSCSGTCHRCNQGRCHLPCSHPCERLLICSHKCREPCTRECPPCKLPCENVCLHSRCMKPCGQSCAPCMEPCAWQCRHQSCGRLCHEPCDRPPCTQPCSKMLVCDHPCIGLCGDKCPDKCRVCDRAEVIEIFFGSEDEPEARFIQLEDCGHIMEATGMDTYMTMDQRSEEDEQMVIKLKECPRCRTPIRKNLRYGSHINRSLAEIEKVKEKINGHQATIGGASHALASGNEVASEMDGAQHAAWSEGNNLLNY